MVSNPNILPLEQAIKIVRQLNFETKTAYQDWWTETRPENLARDVIKVYVESKRKEWPEEKQAELWSFYLGNDVLSNQEKNKRWLSYEEASKACRKAGIKSQNDFLRRLKTGKIPKGVPSRPYAVYKNNGWARPTKNNSGWGVFLGTGSIQNNKLEYWSFKKARAYVRKLIPQIKNEKPEWRNYTKSGKKPKQIPANPKRTYGDEFTNYGDWLGTGTQSNKKKSQSFLSAKEAALVYRKLSKEYGLKTGKDWIKFAPRHKKLLAKLQIPADPLRVYTKERVWGKMKNE